MKAFNDEPSRPARLSTTLANAPGRDASVRATSVGKGGTERSGDKRKAPGSHHDEPPRQVVAPESSAYALLALMASVQQAAQASADERGRTSESYKSWKAAEAARTATDGHAKKRKPTHTVRKEEITALNDEIAQLKSRLAFLRGQSIAPSASQTNTAPQETDAGDPEHPHIPNALLREAIHEQQLSLACARSMVSQFFASDFALPAHSYIHLTKSGGDRLRTLQAIKPHQLRVARRYLFERSRHLNLTKPHAASEDFIADNGDTCTIRFMLSQFPGSVSVRQVFDAATFYTTNLEISFTDGAGRLTIREDDSDIDDPTVAHHRILTTVRPGLFVEANLAMFTHFDKDEDWGIVTSTFVDRDDLHPYRPQERIRQDVTAVLMVSREKDCVVMRRLGHVRIHNNDHFPISDELAKALSEGVSHWGNALVKHARQQCGLDQPEKNTEHVY